MREMIKDMIENGDFELDDNMTGENGEPLPLDNLPDDLKEKLKEKIKEKYIRMKIKKDLVN